jgi:hypothetical protein
MTKLEKYLKRCGIKPAALAKTAKYSRQHLLRIRLGRQEPTRKCIKAITAACRMLGTDKNLQATKLFDL